MRITDVSPAEGPTAGGDLVTITGDNFPERPQVFFGELRASTIVTATGGFLVVRAPQGAPGLVDVLVIDPATGEEAVYPAGYLYVGPDGPGTTTTAPTTQAPTTTTVTTTTSPPGGGIDDWLDGVLVTPEGLTLVEPAADDPIRDIPLELWAGSLCDEPVCPGWVLGS